MGEREEIGVERQAAEGVGSGAVFLIAHDGTPEAGEVDADLVLAAGLKRHFQKRISLHFHEARGNA